MPRRGVRAAGLEGRLLPGPIVDELLDGHVEEFIGRYFRAFGEGERILDIDAKTANGALDLGVAEQNLDRAEVSSLLIDDRRLGSEKRMGAVIRLAQSDRRHTLVDQSSKLPGAHMIGEIDPAREDELAAR